MQHIILESCMYEHTNHSSVRNAMFTLLQTKCINNPIKDL